MSRHGSLRLNWGCTKESGVLPFIFAVAVDAVTCQRGCAMGVLGESLYADNLIMMSETIKGLRNKSIR